jgi:predicted glycogen debranching enzyme
LASPGTFRFELNNAADAVLILATSDASCRTPTPTADEVRRHATRVREREIVRRGRFTSPLARAADAYVVDGRRGKTIVAGYPWFTDWGRDTFIALRGLCLATGRLDDARDMLLAWTKSVSQGMLPNRFPDHGGMPEYNAVDASLWFIVAAYEYLEARVQAGHDVAEDERTALLQAIDAILSGYARGTRFGIRADADGLLACGVPGVQLTWMDAKVGDWVVTPRIGKPVEVQALWLNALAIGGRYAAQWQSRFELGRASFADKFWNSAGGYLYDVVDAQHVAGQCDDSFRPNQLLAIGGLPFQLFAGARARVVVDQAESRLWTPSGPRSLDPQHPDYKPSYSGDPLHRDGAYHQGTVWPWLAGPFVEAWVRVRNSTPAAKAAARERFLEPLLATHLPQAGLGHISEIADGDAPHTPRGCPWQAWSLGEVLRLNEQVLAIEPPGSKLHEPHDEVA